MPEEDKELRELREKRLRSLQQTNSPEQKRKAIIVAESMEELQNQPSMQIPAECPECHHKIHIVIPKSTLKKLTKQMKGGYRHIVDLNLLTPTRELPSKIPVIPAVMRDPFLRKPQFPTDNLHGKRKA